MKIIAPDYYPEFKCAAGKCRHTCCCGWEIAVDDDSLEKYRDKSDILPFVDREGGAHFRLLGEEERCPFLNGSGLCSLILRYGEDILCQTCRDHPRFRSFWSDRIELGLGLVCEEAGRLILGREEKMKLISLSDPDGGDDREPDEDEQWLLGFRQELLDSIRETGPRARLAEYLIYRHIPDALYDGRPEARARFIEASFREITAEWEKTAGTLPELVECCRRWSYDVEYDEEELEKRISAFEE